MAADLLSQMGTGILRKVSKKCKSKWCHTGDYSHAVRQAIGREWRDSVSNPRVYSASNLKEMLANIQGIAADTEVRKFVHMGQILLHMMGEGGEAVFVFDALVRCTCCG